MCNLIGLVFSLFGVLLLFCFALPVEPPSASLYLGVPLSPGGTAQVNFYNRAAFVGLLLLVIGTLLEAVPPVLTVIRSSQRRRTKVPSRSVIEPTSSALVSRPAGFMHDVLDPASVPPATSLPLLFTPGRIGGVELRNRIVMPPMTTRAADSDGFVTDDTIAYYRARASGGVGLITVEMASPERVGKHRVRELGLYDDRFLPGLSRLVSALHDEGAKVSIQLGHGGGHTRPDVNGGETPIAPSAIPHVVQEGTTEIIIPEAMSVARIARTVEAFAQAAERAQAAGFDMVEIHGAHGYLISQFLCVAENRRTDDYGGSLENRARFAIEIVRRIKQRLPGLPLIFRLCGDDFFPGGIVFPEARQVGEWIAAAGADALHVTGGHYRSLPTAAVMIPPMAMGDAPFLHFASALRRRVAVPVIAAARLGDPATAIRALAEGHADFVALGRPLLADSDWVRHAETGQAVRTCLACNSCVDHMRAGNRLHCLINPMTGRERRYAGAADTGGPRDERIAVIGAGPAGLAYASLVAARNTVTVFERGAESGGAFRLAGLAPLFQGVEANPALLLRHVAALERRCREQGVVFEFSCDVARRIELLDGFDRIVVAMGARYVPWLRFMPALLRSGLAGAPVLRGLAARPGARAWFYRRARVSAAAPLLAGLAARPEGRKVEVIGDAALPGKSDAAILGAFDAAFGLAPEGAKAVCGA